jgi:digeranylgeranylglycerophospholipid reductase
MKKFDVVIVGAGTAGLLLAKELGKSKIKTLVVDRRSDLLAFSFKTLASLIDLKKFDLSENVVAQKINKIAIYSNYFKRKVKGDLYVLDKKKVHEEILNSTDNEFVSFLTNVHIKDIQKDSTGKFESIIDKDGQKYAATIFVDASGTNGVLSKKVGFMETSPKLAVGVEYNVKYKGNSDEIHLLIGKVYEGGYGWIFPLKNDRAIIGFGSFEDAVIKDLKNRLNVILEIPKIKKLVEKDNNLVEGGSIPITAVLNQFVQQNLVCVGDSVSQVNPIVGEGYKFIFESAVMASKAIKIAIETNDLDALKAYEKEWNNRFFDNYTRSKKLQDRFFGYSQDDLLMDVSLLFSKFISDKRIITSLSGEYGLEK